MKSPVVGSGPGTPGDEYVGVQFGGCDLGGREAASRRRVVGADGVPTGVHGPDNTGAPAIAGNNT